MMSTFVLTVFTANSTAPLVGNWVASTIGWRYVYWIQMASNGVCWLICLFLFPETYVQLLIMWRRLAGQLRQLLER
jgi:predicted MFS family arabinose efflux permease